MCVQDHEQDVEMVSLVQTVTVSAAELEALRQQAARVPQLEEQVTRLENERRVRLADIERIATKLRVGRLRRPGREAATRRASFINCAAEFASMKHLYSMR